MNFEIRIGQVQIIIIINIVIIKVLFKENFLGIKPDCCQERQTRDNCKTASNWYRNNNPIDKHNNKAGLNLDCQSSLKA